MKNLIVGLGEVIGAGIGILGSLALMAGGCAYVIVLLAIFLGIIGVIGFVVTIAFASI